MAPAGRVVVIGLGPAGPELASQAALDAIARVRVRFVRTRRHPSVSLLGEAVTFDPIYEAAGTVDEVYEAIADVLARAAEEHGEVLYAVPGSPLVAERTVELLRTQGRVELTVVPALSYLDLAWAALGVDPLAAGVRLVDGKRFAVEAAGERGPLLVAQCDSRDVLSDIKLAVDDAPSAPVTVLQRLGLPDEHVLLVPWEDLDRSFEPDHLTTLWIPELAAPVANEVVRFEELVRRLRTDCPWDRVQTHGSLTRHLLEETYEVLEAIETLTGALDGEDDDAIAAAYGHLEEELGDLLFQVLIHTAIAAEAGEFTLADVARGIHDKLVRRHPHVFGTAVADDPGAVVQTWEEIKRAEKGSASVMDGIAGNLPSLLYATKVQKKAASSGFDWPDVDAAFAKIVEETVELRLELPDGPDRHGELGDLLFAVVNVARHADIDAEAALRTATAKFRDRFRRVEQDALADGVRLAELDTAALVARWTDAKAARDEPPTGR